MKKHNLVLAVLMACAFLIMSVGCAQHSVKQAGFLQDYTKLGEDPFGLADAYYEAPNVVWGAYDKAIIDQVTFFLKEDADHKGIDADELNQLAQYWNDSMVKSISKSYQIVSEPGPNTLRMRLAITNLEPGNPATGTVTTVVPVGLAASTLKKATTGTHIGMGEASFEAEIRDAQTDDVLVAGIRKSSGTKYKVAKSVTKWGQVEAIFDEWTDSLLKRLDKLSGR